MGVPGPRPITDEFRVLLRAWHAHLEHHEGGDWPGHDGFIRAVRTCASQLAETIDRAADLEQADEDRAAYDDLANRHDDCPRCPHCGLHRHGGQCSPATPVTLGPAYEGPWYCSGCGATYYGVDSHICPVGVRPIVGGAPVGVFGRDWTYE